jgi:phospholipase/lecithinase/hemolysin
MGHLARIASFQSDTSASPEQTIPSDGTEATFFGWSLKYINL